MDSNSDDLNIEEDDSKIQLPSNPSSEHLGSFIQSTTSSSVSISEETSTEQLFANAQQLKTELKAQYYQDWFNRYEPCEQNPKIELNFLLHSVIEEEILMKDNSFTNDKEIITEIFQNDSDLLQKIFRKLVNDQRQQRIVYTEILFRPEVFNLINEASNIKLRHAMDIIIQYVRSELCDTKTVPLHVKFLLSCNWNNVKSMPEFIRLSLNYPEEIVGIDFYGKEDDCRKYWQDFRNYRQILHHYHIRCQVTMADYQDLQLMTDVINELSIERLSEAYKIVLSSEHLEDIMVKHGLHLVVCPVSNAYNKANDILSETERKRKYQSTNSLNTIIDENNTNHIISYNLINHLQTELLSYSITSLSPIEYKENLSSIYKNLLENNKNSFTCEHMQYLNENALKFSFASQKLKKELMIYIRECYADYYKQINLLEQFQATSQKWQQEMNEIIDRNIQTVVEFDKKMRKEKLLKRTQKQQDQHSKLLIKEENEPDQEE